MQLPDKYLKTLLFAEVAFVVTGAIYKISHYAYADLLLSLGILSCLLLTVICLYEILRADIVPPKVRIIWVVFFFLMNLVATAVYIFFFRRNIRQVA